MQERNIQHLCSCFVVIHSLFSLSLSLSLSFSPYLYLSLFHFPSLFHLPFSISNLFFSPSRIPPLSLSLSLFSPSPSPRLSLSLSSLSLYIYLTLYLSSIYSTRSRIRVWRWWDPGSRGEGHIGIWSSTGTSIRTNRWWRPRHRVSTISGKPLNDFRSSSYQPYNNKSVLIKVDKLSGTKFIMRNVGKNS